MKRLGLNYNVVEADSGKIGGSRSHEFQVVSDVGEDTILRCNSCSYAANVEIAVGDTEPKPMDLPNTEFPSLLALYKHFAMGTKPTRAIVFTSEAHPQPVILFIATNREPNGFKVKIPLGVTQPPHQLEEKEGSKKLQDVTKATILIDTSIHPDVEVWIKNAAQQLGCSEPTLGHFRTAAAGDDCVQKDCKTGKLETTRGIEVGHVFYLGNKYTSKFNGNIKDPYDGTLTNIEMGCYGLGISRLLAAIVETNHDSKGIIWPLGVAPYKVIVLSLASPKEKSLAEDALKIYDLIAGMDGMRGDVVLDDRVERPGYKMNDACLIGFPYMVKVGKPYREMQKVEVEIRKTGAKMLLSETELVQFFKYELYNNIK